MAITFEAHRYKVVSTSFSHDMAYMYSIDAGSNLIVWKWIEDTTEKYDNFKEARKRVRDNLRGQKDTEVNVEKKQEGEEYLSEF